jgi:hypothetical protein
LALQKEVLGVQIWVRHAPALQIWPGVAAQSVRGPLVPEPLALQVVSTLFSHTG